MDPITQAFIQGAAGAGGGATYVDDVFDTEAYVGTGQVPQNHVNGIDLAGEGGMLWVKDRDQANNHVLFDTERGVTKMLRLGNTSAGNETVDNTVFRSFNSDGWSSAAWGGIGQNNIRYGSWTFRNAPGFFKVVKWTGNGVSGRQIAHGLESVPGFVMTKALDNSDNWRTLHRYNFSNLLYINNDTAAQSSAQSFSGTVCDATHLTVTNDGSINSNGQEYIAYVFAGGGILDGRSVDLDGTGDYLSCGPSSDFSFGTGDFTIEGWFKKDDTSQGGFWQVSTTAGGLGAGSAPACAWTGSAWQMYGGGDNTASYPPVTANKWYHIAQVRSSGVTTMYVDGQPVITRNDTADYDGTYIAIGGYYSTPYLHEGQVSNVRVVKGTALYTSTFIPQRKELENISGTVLLCCNGLSQGDSTVSPTSVTVHGNPTMSTTNPPDLVDPASFKFGKEENQNLIQCGSYTGNTSTAPVINCGWEPQFIMIKCTSQASTNWSMFDCIRGIVTDGNEEYLYPNLTSTEYTADRLELMPTGFKVVAGGGVLTNTNGGNYIYVAIRRPDGYVGKPAKLGTDVFAMDAGGNSPLPSFAANFPVDYVFTRDITGSAEMYSTARLVQKFYLVTQTTAADSTSNAFVFDYNFGCCGSGLNSTFQAWMWKRGQGMDVVTYKGSSTSGRIVRHNLSKTPEMIWIKCRTTSESWVVGHKGINDGTNPWEYSLRLNENHAQTDYPYFNDTAPTSTYFTLNNNGQVNGSTSNNYIAMLFASVAGISKVGYYTGNGTGGSSTQTITTGFQPRFIIIKKANGAENWLVFDTVRGWGAGNDKSLKLNSLDAQNSGTWDVGAPTSSGFTLVGNFGTTNASGGKYIYYAHA